MNAGLQSLMTHLIDYAGMFPPAGLPWEEALENYATYRTGPHSSILSRLICKASVLQDLDLTKHMESAKANGPRHLVAIGRGGDDLISALEVLQRDLKAIAVFNQHWQDTAVVDVLEFKLPASVIQGSKDDIEELVERGAEVVASGTPGLRPFCEVTFDERGPEAVYRTLSVLQSFNTRWASKRYQLMGAKFRTGGLEPAAFPTAKHLAFFIIACVKLELPFKVTAGLHHPLCCQDTAIDTKMHGFLNLFVGAVLVHAKQLDLPALVTLLEADTIDDFEFSENGLSWRGHSASLEQIADARKRVAIAFGSCSFQGPIDDLGDLGLA